MRHLCNQQSGVLRRNPRVRRRREAAKGRGEAFGPQVQPFRPQPRDLQEYGPHGRGLGDAGDGEGLTPDDDSDQLVSEAEYYANEQLRLLREALAMLDKLKIRRDHAPHWR
jgi:16S rRNA C967 or C1407 C5-methylase (RsmB/RsmF family)